MIKCVAIDDEPIALSIIEEYCKRYGDVELQCFTSPVSGMECVRATRPDIVFLDIEMNSHNGIELAAELPQGTCLIFTTAFSQYALDGFNVDAVDFLHKPIFYPRFERAMEKAGKFIRPAWQDDDLGSLTLKAEHKTVIVGLKDIILIEAMDNYVKVYRKDIPMLMSQITMKEMESVLPSDRFVRVHRSYIVSTAAIERFSNRTIYLRNHPRPIPVGRKYIQAFNNLSNIFQPK
ncbi:LytR/AlgR family response regulator transcription factor [Muribaculum intestinale]|uniref:LytR/AlgR family response regulator transcription factor n=1 Tax=Muribaculum intestinale TaxID=1796646 RepID=UPI0026392528|nr:LytTR family DNA-binding domain-containing protein [Muribaculum intestinale]